MAIQDAIDEISRHRRDTDFLNDIKNMSARDLLDTLFTMPLHEEKWTDEERWRLAVVKSELYGRTDQGV
jgi:hypothetical protein